MSLFSKILSWRTSTATTDPEQSPSRTTATDPSLEPSAPENPTATSPATSIPTTPSPMLTQAIPAMNVGLRPSAFITPPAWARPVHTAIVERFHSRVRDFYQTGINIARFVLGSVIDLAPQREEANEENGVDAPPQGTRNSSRHRWLWVSLVAVVGVMALATMMVLQNHTFYRELLEMVRRIA